MMCSCGSCENRVTKLEQTAPQSLPCKPCTSRLLMTSALVSVRIRVTVRSGLGSGCRQDSHATRAWQKTIKHFVCAAFQATLIEYNLGQVDQAILAVNVLVAQGMDWHQLGQMVKAERRAGNPVCHPFVVRVSCISPQGRSMKSIYVCVHSGNVGNAAIDRVQRQQCLSSRLRLHNKCVCCAGGGTD